MPIPSRADAVGARGTRVVRDYCAVSYTLAMSSVFYLVYRWKCRLFNAVRASAQFLFLFQSIQSKGVGDGDDETFERIDVFRRVFTSRDGGADGGHGCGVLFRGVANGFSMCG